MLKCKKMAVVLAGIILMMGTFAFGLKNYDPADKTADSVSDSVYGSVYGSPVPAETSGPSLEMASAATDETYDEMKYNEESSISSPFRRDSSQEYVDPVTGTLQVTATDLVLKGRNGLDLSLTRIYDHSDAEMFIPISKTEKNAVSDYSGVGCGWSFDFPQVRKVKGDGKFLYYHGSVYKLVPDTKSHNYSIDNYKLQDITFSDNNHSFNNGETRSEYVLREKSGKCYYMEENGNLIGISDRFDNKITFTYNRVYKIYSKGNSFKLNKIVDSVGREILFDNSYTLLTVNVKDPADQKQTRAIKYYKIFSSVPKLQKVVDPANRTTEYIYAKNKVHFRFNHTEKEGIDNYYLCLAKIKYPTGLQSNFTYKEASRRIGNNSETDYYRIDDFYQTIDKNDVNYKTYHDDVNGFGNWSNAYQENRGHIIPKDFSFTITIEENLKYTINKYDYRMLLVKQESL